VFSTLMWCSDAMPADIAVGEDVEDMGARILGTAPPENGSRFIVMEFAPGVASEMHRTETLDYIAVLDGEIDMDMDDSTVTLRAGDVMVQRGTNHAWVNRAAAPARLAIVLLDAEPLGIGHPRRRGEQAR
jgi:quercetin dioxygenase-like cupin family protein